MSTAPTDTIFSSQIFHLRDVPLTEPQSSSMEGDGSCQGGGGVSNEDGRGWWQQRVTSMADVAAASMAVVGICRQQR